MALLNRLFPSKKKNVKQGYVSFGRNDSVSWKPFNFSKEQVRVLLFRECDARGRKLLFDSNAVQKTPLENQQCTKPKFGSRPKSDTNKNTETYVEISNGFGYQYMRPSSDVTLMGEMIFGSVAMTFRGTALKVHSMNSPERLMCTKVFHAPVANVHNKRISDHSLEDSYGSSMNSVGEYVSGQGTNSDTKLGSSCGSGPLDVPFSSLRGKAPTSSLEGDSGFCGDASLHSISSMSSGGFFTTSPDSRNGSGSVLGNGSSQSGGSLASLQRRWLRNMSTSLEMGVNNTWCKSTGLFSSFNTDEALPYSHRKTQLGLTIIISLTPEEEKEMQQFVFELMAVIESMVERLRWSVERAYIRKDMFVHLMMEGYHDFQQWLCDLFSTPRIPNPMWMSLISTSNQTHNPASQRNLATTFLRDLCQLIAAIDTKATNFFVSTLVTAVLTHHLGWVATVLPAKGPPHNISKLPCTTQMLSALAKSHPYNALWAQLGDLYGALGNPTRVARTIVTANGKKVEILNRLLSSLSYFIRCGDIEKRIDNRVSTGEDIETLNTILNDLPSPSMKSSTASTSTILAGECLEKVPNHVPKLVERETDKLGRCSSLLMTANETKPSVQVSFNEQNLNSKSGLMWEKSKHMRASVVRGNDKAKEFEGDLGSNNSTTTLCDNQVSFSQVDKILNSKTCCNIQNVNCISDDKISVRSDKCAFFKNSVGDVPQDVCETIEPVPKVIQGMKRSTSFMGKNSIDSEAERTNLISHGSSRLYPSISDLMLEEDGKVKEELFPHPEVISEKVIRLCRVPTKAVLYHLQDSQTTANSVKDMLPRKVESERQLSSVDVYKQGGIHIQSVQVSSEKYRRSPDSPVKFTFDGGSDFENTSGAIQTSNEADSVIFVLGEDEELVGLRGQNKNSINKCKIGTDSSSINKSNRSNFYPSLDEMLQSEDIVPKHNSFSNNTNTLKIADCHEQSEKMYDVSERLNSTSLRNEELCNDGGFVFNKESGLDSGIVLDEQLQDLLPNFVDMKYDHVSNSSVECNDERTSKICISQNSKTKVVTSHSSVIELEDECGGVEINIADTERKSLKPVVRSQSLSFPLHKSASKKKTNICRRHSEYIHENERYLKNYHSVRFHFERCESVLVDYVEGTGIDKSPQMDKKSLKLNEARGNFELQENSAKPYPCDNCCVRQRDVNSNPVLSNEGLCSNCDSCTEEEVADNCSITKCHCSEKIGLHSQNDENREGNALFDDYGTLSDEDASNSNQCHKQEGETRESKTEIDEDEDRSVLQLPLPRFSSIQPAELGPGIAASLLGGVTDHYVADLVLQGCTQPVQGWEKCLRRDLLLAAHQPFLDQEISEAVCIVGNVDLWEVQLVSSHVSVVDNPGTFGIRVGMSQLVANMLESLVHLWRLRTPPDQCLLHLESKLRELCLRSQALAELLLTTEFCDMASLTAALGLEANDVPLLLAVASTHTPQVTRHYGLSFR